MFFLLLKFDSRVDVCCQSAGILQRVEFLRENERGGILDTMAINGNYCECCGVAFTGAKLVPGRKVLYI